MSVTKASAGYYEHNEVQTLVLKLFLGGVSLPLGDARRYQACHLLYETTQGEQSQTVSVPRDL